MHIAVVIPVYKPTLSDDEKLSLQQCLRVLGKYPMLLVCPQGMDTSTYDLIKTNKFQKQTFAHQYFTSIDSYSRLMKSPSFYECFCDFDYILIYQLDAWVFCDELEEWCKKGYDYVGAPWFDHYRSHEEGHNLWLVGNGGLSLRRTKKFLSLTTLITQLQPFTRIKSCQQVFESEYHSIRDLPRCLIHCMGPWIGTNSFRHIHKKLQEDGFFCEGLSGSDYQLHVPNPKEAAFFSFERSPKYLYEEVTRGKLPFGCHAWRKYQYSTFWKHYIYKSSLEQ